MHKRKPNGDARKRLLEAARRAMKNAYAPYSKFKVGAALLTTTGRVGNSKMQWNGKRTTLEQWGGPPPCIEPIVGTVTRLPAVNGGKLRFRTPIHANLGQT